MTNVRELHTRWMADSEYREAHQELKKEYELARAIIRARYQEQLAERRAATQSAVARLESGRVRPSTKILERLA